MAITWGPTVGDEAAAGRYNRDVAERGGDVNYTYNATTGAPEANLDVDGRNEREYYQIQDDRNERVYVGPNGETPLADAAEADAAEDVLAGEEVD